MKTFLMFQIIFCCKLGFYICQEHGKAMGDAYQGCCRGMAEACKGIAGVWQGVAGAWLGHGWALAGAWLGPGWGMAGA